MQTIVEWYMKPQDSEVLPYLPMTITQFVINEFITLHETQSILHCESESSDSQYGIDPFVTGRTVVFGSRFQHVKHITSIHVHYQTFLQATVSE